MCCLTALLSYQKGARFGVVSAIIITAIAFTLDPYAVHPFPIKVIASTVAFAAASVVSRRCVRARRPRDRLAASFARAHAQRARPRDARAWLAHRPRATPFARRGCRAREQRGAGDHLALSSRDARSGGRRRSGALALPARYGRAHSDLLGHQRHSQGDLRDESAARVARALGRAAGAADDELRHGALVLSHRSGWEGRAGSRARIGVYAEDRETSLTRAREDLPAALRHAPDDARRHAERRQGDASLPRQGGQGRSRGAKDSEEPGSRFAQQLDL